MCPNKNSKAQTRAVARGMESRGGVRSSARLSGEAARSGGSGSSGNGRPAEVAAAAAAAAALRRERAAERAREIEDSPRVLREKCRRLARALRNAKHLVVSAAYLDHFTIRIHLRIYCNVMTHLERMCSNFMNENLLF